MRKSKSGEPAERQSKQYDKVLKENIEATLPGIMRHLIGVDADSIEGLSDSVQHTNERVPDVLKKVTDKEGNVFVLQIEFQSKNDPEMAYRMAEYYIMLWRKYNMSVKQYVIYVSEKKLRMSDELSLEYMNFRYALVSLLSVDYRMLLQSEQPEAKMLALLADFGGEDPKIVTADIVQQVISSARGSLDGQRYMQQLRILGKLRKLVSLNTSVMFDITRYILEETDITTDLLYQRGAEIGMAEGQKEKSIEVIRNLLASSKLTIVEIANVVGVTEAFVLEARAKRK